MTHAIGKLQRVPLREVWKHEAYDFTQWLQDNIDILNEALDLDLVSAEREQAAGAFSVDLVAENGDGSTYVIENQLEKSNHDHLGKVITYLTAMKARGAIWIVAEPRQEHANAMAWLNEASNADFYLVKVEAVRIGDSPAAPLLTLIVGPSVEAKEIGGTQREITERHLLRKRWWAQLIANPAAKLHAHITPGIANWIGISAGMRGLGFNYTVTQTECSAELYIDRGQETGSENEAIFEKILQGQAQIEAAIDQPVYWERLEGRRACRIRIKLLGGYRSPETDWPEIQTRLATAMNQLEAALRPALKNLKLGN